MLAELQRRLSLGPGLGGAALSLLLVAGIAPVPVLVVLWTFYLSLVSVGRIFLAYQWDALLLESGFLAIFLAPGRLLPAFSPASEPAPTILWLFWWLLFRLMFSAGAVKLRSGDVSWRKLTALCAHYETQPLPTPAAWWAHQLPMRFHKFSAAVVLVIELGAPFLIVGPPRLRYVAAVLFMVFMALIQLTGNYGFFNLLGFALSVLLLDDRFLLPVFRWAFPGFRLPPAVSPPPGFEWIALAIGVLLLGLSVQPVLRLARFELRLPGWLAKAMNFFEPLRLVNSYGLFASMTLERPELIVEGSNDGEHWRTYRFKWKPDDVDRAPRFVAPHQPRLDWQMWFAAIGWYPNNPWFGRFLDRLLEGSPSVLALLAVNPFPGLPPREVRAVVYDYRFTTRAERRVTGAWWKRERRGLYSPVRQRCDERVL